MNNVMIKITLLAGVTLAGYLFYNSVFFEEFGFWGVIMPASYMLTFALLITTR